jgi:MFS family permease
MVLSLGVVWIFDGYEVSLISLFRKYIIEKSDESTFKSLATAYQVGCIVGSLIFGIAGFTVGRKKIFIVTIS